MSYFYTVTHAENEVLSPFDTRMSSTDEKEEEIIFPEDLEQFDVSNKGNLYGEIESETLYHADRNERSIINPENLLNIDRIEEILKVRLNYDTKINTNLSSSAKFRYYFLPNQSDDELDRVISNQHIFWLDEAKLVYTPTDSTIITFGKQRIFWGTGLVWNPTNEIINPTIDIKDFIFDLSEKSGVTGLRGEYLFGNSSIEGIFVPEISKSLYHLQDKDETFSLWTENPIFSSKVDLKEEKHTLAGLKFGTVLFDTDLSLSISGEKGKRLLFGADFAKIIFDHIEIHAEAAFQKGNRKFFVPDGISPQTFDPNDPILIQLKKDSKNFFPKFVLGARYRSSSDFRVLFEYYHDGENFSEKELQTFTDFMTDFAEAGIDDAVKFASQLAKESLGKNYFYLQLDRPNIRDFFSPLGSAIYNIDDGSYRLNLSLGFELHDNMQYLLDVDYFGGSNDTEYGMLLDDVLIRLTLKYTF